MYQIHSLRYTAETGELLLNWKNGYHTWVWIVWLRVSMSFTRKEEWNKRLRQKFSNVTLEKEKSQQRKRQETRRVSSRHIHARDNQDFNVTTLTTPNLCRPCLCQLEEHMTDQLEEVNIPIRVRTDLISAADMNPCPSLSKVFMPSMKSAKVPVSVSLFTTS